MKFELYDEAGVGINRRNLVHEESLHLWLALEVYPWLYVINVYIGKM